MAPPPIYKPLPSVPHLPNPLPAVSSFTFAFPPAKNDQWNPHSPAFIDARTGHTITRREFRSLALSVGHGLRAALPSLIRSTVSNVRWDGSLKRGDTVLLFSPNSLAFPLALHGAIAGGLRVSCANPAYTAEELLHQFTDCEAKAILAHPLLVPLAVEVLRKAGHCEAGAQARCLVLDYQGLSGEKAPKGFVTFDSLIAQGTLAEEERFDGKDAQQTAFLCYSSGTTGRAKGVMTTHSNLTSNLLMITYHSAFMDNGATHLGCLPFYHIFGLNNLLFHAPYRGVPVVVLPRFEPIAFLKAVERYKVTVILLVPPILLVLLQHPETAKHDLRSLKTVMSGAAPLGAALVKAFREKLAAQGADVAVSQGYGLTETSPTMMLLQPQYGVSKVGSAGTLMAGLEVRLVGEDEQDAPVGGPGEIWVRGPSIMKGYNRNEKATKDSITPDGWFKTGDIGTVDEDGFYYIVDRKKELIKYKGFQVPPAELESVLLGNPEVADASVIGIESVEQATELPLAYVVPANPSVLKSSSAEKRAFAEKVQHWVGERVAAHKRLRGGVVLIAAIPKSPSGKILRRELREAAKKGTGEAFGRTKARL